MTRIVADFFADLGFRIWDLGLFLIPVSPKAEGLKAGAEPPARRRCATVKPAGGRRDG